MLKLPEWTTPATDATADLREQVDQLANQVQYERDTSEMLLESLADLELAAEDRGWSLLGTQGQIDFSESGRRKIAENCRLTLVANPLAKRAVQLRTGYIWGQGVSISVEDADPEEGDAEPQDVNAVLQEFIDDDRNRDVLFGAQAHEDNEAQLATQGEIFYCLVTNPLTGKVVVRSIDPDEITETVTNPDDANEPWYYRRVFVRRAPSINGSWESTSTTFYYPAVGYNPRGTDRLKFINGNEVRWLEPIRAMIVNKPSRKSQRGVGDLYSVLPWIRASKEILEAWVLLFKALTRYAYQVKTKGDRTAQAAQRIRSAQVAQGPQGNVEGVGATYVGGNDSSIEAVSKTGATIDANSARPVQMMIAAGVGLPITMLLGDPGITGARATAETLDEPTKLVMSMRRDQHREALIDIANYVLNWAIKVGRLSGSVTYDGSREIATLAGDQDRTVQIEWPSYDSESVQTMIASIVDAGGLDVMPKALLLRLVLNALKVKDADKIIDANTDDAGRWRDLDAERNDQGGDTGEVPPGQEIPDATDTGDVPPGPEGTGVAGPNG